MLRAGFLFGAGGAERRTIIAIVGRSRRAAPRGSSRSPRGPAPDSGAPVTAGALERLQDFKDRAEREFILASLNANDWQMAATAKAISTPRSNLYKKLEAHDIRRES